MYSIYIIMYTYIIYHIYVVLIHAYHICIRHISLDVAVRIFDSQGGRRPAEERVLAFIYIYIYIYI